MNSNPEQPLQTLSQACSYSSLSSDKLRHWAEKMRPYWDETQSGIDVPLHRKIWEWSFIASALAENDMLRPGTTGLGFGVGKEPLVPLFASLGSKIVATDQSAETAGAAGWSESNQFAGGLAAMNEKTICDPHQFDKLVSFRTVDMRKIPRNLREFDFTWSSCAFEHLGTIEKGLTFIIDQMLCLRPGGIAVHTTEFNVSSLRETIESGPTVLFRQCDLEKLAKKLKSSGHELELDFTLGTTEADLHVDSPPWSGAHLRLDHDGYVITSFGLVIRRGFNRNLPSFSRFKSRRTGRLIG
ncbi:MAG: class I SAM-dependent methyltransferase [Actinomycetota bacterium]|nr:class I SAM-dependent methyltransferase [Actinomycetota bacterium]